MKDLNKEEISDLLRTTGDGVLSLSEGNKPYGIPFGFIYAEDKVYLSMLPMGRKWKILSSNDSVSFTVFKWNDDHSEWSSVVIDGKMTVVKSIGEIELVVRENIKKVGLDSSDGYLEKRMEMYEKNLENPKSLKILRIDTESVAGKKMKTMIGK